MEAGVFAAANPVVMVKFTATEPGITVEGAGTPVEIAGGSGASFPVRFTDATDTKARWDGFAVLVNGELKSGSQLVQSFRSEAVVPRHVGPIPCKVVFTGSRSFTIGIFDTQKEVMNWNTGLGFSMLGRREQREFPGASVGGRGRGSMGPPRVVNLNARLIVPGQSASADDGLAESRTWVQSSSF